MLTSTMLHSLVSSTWNSIEWKCHNELQFILFFYCEQCCDKYPCKYIFRNIGHQLLRKNSQEILGHIIDTVFISCLFWRREISSRWWEVHVVWVQVCVHVCNGRRLTLCVFTLDTYWGRVSHLNPELTSLAGLATQLSLGIPCLYQHLCECWRFRLHS